MGVRKLNSNKILFQLANVGTAGLAYLILPISMSISSPLKKVPNTQRLNWQYMGPKG